jgi:putative membrane protein
MIVWILLRWLVSAVAIWAAAAWIPGIEVHGGFWTYLWLALLLGLVNAILGTILRILTLPLTILTLGLFAIIVNTAVLAATAGLSSKLSIDDFWAALWAALVIAIVSTVLGLLVPDQRRTVSA